MHRTLKLLGLLALLDLLLVAAYLGWAQQMVADASGAAPYDVGIVFYADFDRNGELGAESRRRADAAAALFRSGAIPRLIAVGGRRHHPDRFGSVLVGERLQQLGVPATAITVDRHSFDTVGNWQQAVKMLHQQRLQRPLLISSSLHLARIRFIAAEPFPIALAASQPLTTALRQRPLQTWLDTHREWLAWAAMALLPASLHQQWVQQWRDLWH